MVGRPDLSGRGMQLTAAALILLVSAAACGTGTGSPVPPQRQESDYGAGIYRYECASCHTPGRVAPPLGADAITARFAGAAELERYIANAMPYGRPRTLAAGDNWAVTAYILRQDRLLPRSAAELTPATAARVRFPRGAAR